MCARATLRCGLPSASVLTCRRCSTHASSSQPCSRHSHAATSAPERFLPIWQLMLTATRAP
eukprot:7152888-Prymnesium_polylepis.1